MLFPYNSDAPIHHFPWGTIGIIILNTLIFILWSSDIITDNSYIEWWVLSYDDDFHLIQMLTSAFAHADFMHLFGNMLFLWTFGLIVEGKLGWKLYVPMYLAIAIAVAIMELIIMGGSHGGSLGASSVIMALIVCALFWAPLNHMGCLFVMFPIIRTVELPVWGVATFFILWDLIFAAILGFGPSTSLLHALGFLAGIAPAYYLLTKNKVDCEGWDLLTIKKNGRPEYGRKWKATPEPIIEELPRDKDQEWDSTLHMFREYLTEGEPLLAQRVFDNACVEIDKREMTTKDQIGLINSFLKKSALSDALPLLETFHRNHPENINITLQLASIYISNQERPAAAKELIASIAENSCNTTQQQQMQK